ncbi:PREDICTED: pollen receptor-like kinase 4 [Theobroma cacao]|uniref:non-specific serine/threonine protein kinase n=1 Tax=Theobroma cacao TaxID=3641 RepID=A0AB32UZW1_THECC|nr:PREDICTED: pollen receptor-like kinase 4 [Theobroma cacao]
MLMGAHIARLVRTPNPSLALALVSLLSLVAISYGDTDMETLLTFKDSLANPSALSNWNASISPCHKDRANWIGVLCLNNTIWGLQLENMGLAGLVNIEILAALPNLRTISLMNNNFEGTMPDIRKLGALKALYLSNNRFAGQIPNDAFKGMRSLKKVFLANNAFTGTIPLSLTTLPKLVILRLEGNQFVGQIPDFKHKSVKVVNLASNQLEGPIPASLSKMGASMFSGNRNLCGQPLQACTFTSPPPSPSPKPSASPQTVLSSLDKEISALKIALILVSIMLLVVIIAAIIFIIPQKKQKSKVLEATDLDDSNKLPAYDEGEKKVSEGGGAMKRSDHGKLIFLKDDLEAFDLQDLLRASAEVLGSGNFGASYKAGILNGEAVVVKRYKQMNNVGREDFHEHMRRLGRLNHQNLLPLVAYYYRREEKLLISEFMENGSLASHLHANHSLDQPGLDWPTRLKIIKGVARGLIYLYNELPTLVVPHGHLKSSNVLLDKDLEPLLSDYALRPVINQEQAHMVMTAYKSPEYAINGRISGKTDVWCLGILILEVLTGKFPENYLTPGYDSNTNLATWVNEMVKEKKSSEVFDKEMAGTKNSKGEMINLLKIGLSCCEEDFETRPELKEVVQKIEQLKEGDDEDFSSTIGEVNAVIFRGNMEDESYFSLNR